MAQVLLLLLLLLLLQTCVVHTFMQPRFLSTTSLTSHGSSSSSSSRSSSTLLYQSTPSNSNSNKINRSDKKENNNEKTLYDILGASQRDTQSKLKIRYKALARKLHPDARININDSTPTGYPELSEINAAWLVLGDPRERLKYDRELNAKAFTEGLEAVVTLGFRTAIPFLRKTAETTVAAVETSSKAVNDGADEWQKNVGIYELEQSSRQWEQKATFEVAKINKMKKQLETVPTRRIKTLESQNINKITSAEATRILRTYNPPSKSKLQNDIDAFAREERTVQDGNRKRAEAEKARRVAERQVEQAVRAETLAAQRLEEAQRALAVAQENAGNAQDRRAAALKQEQAGDLDMSKIGVRMQQCREKVRTGLIKAEDKFLESEAKNLRQEIKRSEEAAKEYKIQANKLKAQSELKKLDDQ